MQTISLNGKWNLRQAGKTETIPATVPGDVYRDLLQANRIPDPFYRDNENFLQWIGESDWTYSRSFFVEKAFLSRDRILLHANGLDTFANIRINGRAVGKTDNMYRTWEFDVKRLLKSGRNTIQVHFTSVVPYIHKRQKGPRPLTRGSRGEIHGRAWVRKEPCNFGWDWGIKAITCGIWRDLDLVAFNTARLADFHIRQDHRPDHSVILNVSATAETLDPTPLTARVTVSFGGRTLDEKTLPIQKGVAAASLTVKDARLWWPNNLGSQPLYSVSIALLDPAGRALDQDVKRVGLRTLRLDRHADTWGESFQFVVNGVPFFAKGANWIPADAILSRLTHADYERLIADSAAANMNTLRVWGGGIYENDVFYDLCDEYGICVWQDFMFACSNYPTYDPAFMASVREEFKDNVRRLRHHPCLALWCGNNEVEQINIGPDWKRGDMPWADYKKLFDRLLPQTIAPLDPDRDYWPSSPHSPSGDRDDWNNPKVGDAHLWSVWHGQKPFEWYRTCEHRFNSEFGFQSFPEPKTVHSFTQPQDRNVTSYIMEHHQRSGIGNTTIMRYMLDWYRLPSRFDMTLWLSQVLHGMAMKYAVEHWRRSMPRGMGTLYWQLNDCWPVASWASIDSFGRWKALQYMATHFFAPRLVSGVENLETGGVEIHVTNDLREPARGTVNWTLTTVAGRKLAEDTKPVVAKPLANTCVATLDLKRHLDRQGPRDLILWLELRNGKRVISDNLVTFARPKHLELARPQLTRQITALDDGCFQVTLRSDKPALWVWLELKDLDARLGDNFVHLRPGRPLSIRVAPARKIGAGEFKRRLLVRSLVDTYDE